MSKRLLTPDVVRFDQIIANFNFIPDGTVNSQLEAAVSAQLQG